MFDLAEDMAAICLSLYLEVDSGSDSDSRIFAFCV